MILLLLLFLLPLLLPLSCLVVLLAAVNTKIMVLFVNEYSLLAADSVVREYGTILSGRQQLGGAGDDMSMKMHLSTNPSSHQRRSQMIF